MSSFSIMHDYYVEVVPALTAEGGNTPSWMTTFGELYKKFSSNGTINKKSSMTVLRNHTPTISNRSNAVRDSSFNKPNNIRFPAAPTAGINGGSWVDRYIAKSAGTNLSSTKTFNRSVSTNSNNSHLSSMNVKPGSGSKKSSKKMSRKLAKITTSCPVCSFTSGEAEKIQQHLFAHGKSSENEGVNVCVVCGYLSSHSHHFKRHLLQHSGYLPHKCEICPFRTQRLEVLRKHTERHSKSPPPAVSSISTIRNPPPSKKARPEPPTPSDLSIGDWMNRFGLSPDEQPNQESSVGAPNIGFDKPPLDVKPNLWQLGDSDLANLTPLSSAPDLASVLNASGNVFNSLPLLDHDNMSSIPLST